MAVRMRLQYTDRASARLVYASIEEEEVPANIRQG